MALLPFGLNVEALGKMALETLMKDPAIKSSVEDAVSSLLDVSHKLTRIEAKLDQVIEGLNSNAGRCNSDRPLIEYRPDARAGIGGSDPRDPDASGG